MQFLREKIKPKLDTKVKIGSSIALHLSEYKLKYLNLSWRFFEGGKEVATVRVKYFPDKKVAFINNIDVNEEFRSNYSSSSRGYGRSVLDLVNEKLKRKGVIGILTDDTSSKSRKNHQNISGWYKRNGWLDWPHGSIIKYLYFKGRDLSAKDISEIDILIRSNSRLSIRRKYRAKLGL